MYAFVGISTLLCMLCTVYATKNLVPVKIVTPPMMQNYTACPDSHAVVDCNVTSTNPLPKVIWFKYVDGTDRKPLNLSDNAFNVWTVKWSPTSMYSILTVHLKNDEYFGIWYIE